MKKIAKGLFLILAPIVLLVVLFLSLFLIFPLLNDYDLNVMTKDFRKRELDERGIPTKTDIVQMHDAIEGPFSSNYCAPFSGILLKTELSYEEFMHFYPQNIEPTQIAWLSKEELVFPYTRKGVETHPYDCYTCFPFGLKVLLDEYKDSWTSNINYVVLYETDHYISDFDTRCN